MSGLSFFYHDLGGEVGLHSRMYYFQSQELERIEVVPDTRWGDDFHDKHLFSRSLALKQGFGLPGVEDLRLSEEQLKAYDDLDDVVMGFNDGFLSGPHQFFGIPQYIWQDEPSKHQLMANFGECADRVLFYIPETDVAAPKTSRLHVIYECS